MIKLKKAMTITRVVFLCGCGSRESHFEALSQVLSDGREFSKRLRDTILVVSGFVDGFLALFLCTNELVL